MIETYSKFLYGFTLTSSNNAIDLKEGSDDPVQVLVEVGAYTATTICDAIADALNAEGLLTYSVTFNRATRAFTITGSGSFQLQSLTGISAGSGIYSTIGISQAADTTAGLTVTGTAAGLVYEPQYWLQDYVSSEDYQQSVDATVNKSASGKVEIYRVGLEKFVEFNIKWITNRTTTGTVIRNNSSGLEDARTFMQFITTKAAFEFMPDEDTPSTFQTLILESTPTSSNGTGYKIDEQYERNLPGFYETGKLKMRVIE